jgi:hypothetical protein
MNIFEDSIIEPIRKWALKRKRMRRIRRWEKKGRPIPPPREYKQCTVQRYAERNRIRIFVETGTFMGAMIDAISDDFEKIYTIELSKEIYKKAKERFKHKGHIEFIHGDSGEEIGKVLQKINKPALFWLDSHYSGGITAKGSKYTPIYEELSHIMNAQNLPHIILIDDARCFGTDPGYPTIEELKDFIISRKKNVEILVENDIIRVVLRDQDL